jgi:hypothetical protein
VNEHVVCAYPDVAFSARVLFEAFSLDPERRTGTRNAAVACVDLDEGWPGTTHPRVLRSAASYVGVAR